LSGYNFTQSLLNQSSASITVLSLDATPAVYLRIIFASVGGRMPPVESRFR
jgi:hypothetical protein